MSYTYIKKQKPIKVAGCIFSQNRTHSILYHRFRAQPATCDLQLSVYSVSRFYNKRQGVLLETSWRFWFIPYSWEADEADTPYRFSFFREVPTASLKWMNS